MLTRNACTHARHTRTRTRLRTALVATALLTPLSACGSGVVTTPDIGVVDNPPAVPEQEEAQAEQLEDQVGETTDDAAGLGEDAESGLSQAVLADRIGETVEVSAEVTRVIAPGAFTLGGREVGEDPVVVLAPSAPDVALGDVVDVTGTVVALDEAQVEEALAAALPDGVLPGAVTDTVVDAVTDAVGGPAIRADAVEVGTAG